MPQCVGESADSSLHHSTDAASVQWTTSGTQPQPVARVLLGQCHASLVDPHGDCAAGLTRQRDDPLLVPLADHSDERRVVDILDLEARELRDTHAGGVQHFEQGSISDVERPITVDGIEQVAERPGRNRLRQVQGPLRLGYPFRRIGTQETSAHTVIEECSDCRCFAGC